MPTEVTEKVKNAVLYSDGSVKIENVRLSYPHLDKPYSGPNAGEGGEPKYGVVALLPKDTHKEAMNLVKRAIEGLLKDANKGAAIPKDKWFLRDGDESGKPENQGTWTISARETAPPILRDQRNRNVERAEAAKVFYGGCYASVLIRPWFQNNRYGKRVNANLLAVQFVKDGPPFGTGRIREDDVDDRFAAVEDEGGSDYDNDDEL
jgi:hypothetical protein